MSEQKVAESERSSAGVMEPAEEAAQRAHARGKRKPKRQPPYHVILWDDDDHTYAYVMTMLHKLFGHPLEKGYQLATQVDRAGRAIVLTTTKEHAELKRDQIHAFGKDDQIRGCSGSMSATIEPAQ